MNNDNELRNINFISVGAISHFWSRSVVQRVEVEGHPATKRLIATNTERSSYEDYVRKVPVEFDKRNTHP